MVSVRDSIGAGISYDEDESHSLDSLKQKSLQDASKKVVYEQ